MEDLPGRKASTASYYAVFRRVVAVLENGSGDATMNSGSAGTATFISIFSALTLVYCF